MPADRAANLAMWNRLEVSDPAQTKPFDRGQFKGTAVDALYNVKRLTGELGRVGEAWGWEVKSERLDTFGVGEDQQVIHTCVLRAWFRQPGDGSKEYVEHVGHTKAAYWTRPRRPGDKPRFVVDEEFAKKSVTDALSKIMVSLGASADVWLGRFDGNKYVAPGDEGNGTADQKAAAEALLDHARAVLGDVREAATPEALVAAGRRIKGAFNEQPFWPQLVVADRDLAAEIQQLARRKAQEMEVDLSRDDGGLPRRPRGSGPADQGDDGRFWVAHPDGSRSGPFASAPKAAEALIEKMMNLPHAMAKALLGANRSLVELAGPGAAGEIERLLRDKAGAPINGRPAPAGSDRSIAGRPAADLHRAG